MAISFIQGMSNGAANAGPVTVTFDATPAVNDVILAYYCDAAVSDKAMPAISGYTLANELYADGAGFDANTALYWKYSAGTETNIVGPDMAGTADGVSMVVMVFRGVALSGDGGPFTTAVTTSTGTTGNPDPPQIATAAGDVVVTAVGHASSIAPTFTAPTNYATNAELGTAGADTQDARAGMAYRTSGYSNPEDPGVWTLTGGTSNEGWTCVTIALKEPPAAVPYPMFHTADRSIYTGPTDA